MSDPHDLHDEAELRICKRWLWVGFLVIAAAFLILAYVGRANAEPAPPVLAPPAEWCAAYSVWSDAAKDRVAEVDSYCLRALVDAAAKGKGGPPAAPTSQPDPAGP